MWLPHANRFSRNLLRGHTTDPPYRGAHRHGEKNYCGCFIRRDDDLVIASITVAELLTGGEFAPERQRTARQDFVEILLEVPPVEPYDEAVARAYARLLAHMPRTGTPRGARDLIIMATAIATSRTLIATHHSTRFDELPGVDSVVVKIG